MLRLLRFVSLDRLELLFIGLDLQPQLTGLLLTLRLLAHQLSLDLFLALFLLSFHVFEFIFKGLQLGVFLVNLLIQSFKFLLKILNLTISGLDLLLILRVRLLQIFLQLRTLALGECASF